MCCKASYAPLRRVWNRTEQINSEISLQIQKLENAESELAAIRVYRCAVYILRRIYLLICKNQLLIRNPLFNGDHIQRNFEASRWLPVGHSSAPNSHHMQAAKIWYTPGSAISSFHILLMQTCRRWKKKTSNLLNFELVLSVFSFYHQFSRRCLRGRNRQE